MKKTDWKDIAEVVGIAAIVASLIFVGLQMQQEQEIAIVDTYGSVVESNEVALNLIAANPEVWDRGINGADLSAADEVIFSSMVRAVTAHFYHNTIRLGRITDFDPYGVLNEFAFAIYVYPGLRRQWELNEGYRGQMDAAFGQDTVSPLQRGVIDSLKGLDVRQPDMPKKKPPIFWMF
jgi:hypothetical protein